MYLVFSDVESFEPSKGFSPFLVLGNSESNEHLKHLSLLMKLGGSRLLKSDIFSLLKIPLIPVP